MKRAVVQHRGEIAEGDGSMLAGQLRLLEEKRAEVEALRQRGGGPDDALAKDLAGVRFVLRAALLADGLTEAKREELERSERVARELLRRTVAPEIRARHALI